MWSTLALIGAFAACGLMLWAANRIEPHWSSKDGGRFTCRVQRLGQHDMPLGTWREMRATAEHDGIHLTARGLRGRDLRGVYTILGQAPDAPRGKAMFICGGPTRIVLRIPTKSRALPVLAELAAHH